MNKFTLIFALVLSTTLFSQNDILDKSFTRSISQEDLPIGKSFIVLTLDGTPAFAGIIDAETIGYMPRNTPFVLKLTGSKLKRFNIYDRKTLKN
jgi:hypothetical protein